MRITTNRRIEQCREDESANKVDGDFERTWNSTQFEVNQTWEARERGGGASRTFVKHGKSYIRKGGGAS